jgi:hypothetical protein
LNHNTQAFILYQTRKSHFHFENEKHPTEIDFEAKTNQKYLTCRQNKTVYGTGRIDHAEDGRKHNGGHYPELVEETRR